MTRRERANDERRAFETHRAKYLPWPVINNWCSSKEAHVNCTRPEKLTLHSGIVRLWVKS